MWGSQGRRLRTQVVDKHEAAASAQAKGDKEQPEAGRRGALPHAQARQPIRLLRPRLGGRTLRMRRVLETGRAQERPRHPDRIPGCPREAVHA